MESGQVVRGGVELIAIVALHAVVGCWRLLVACCWYRVFIAMAEEVENF